jgi:hypothetical protein
LERVRSSTALNAGTFLSMAARSDEYPPPDPRWARAISDLAEAIRPAPAPPRAAPFQTVAKVIETLLPSIVMFALGFLFVQRVELDLKRDEFTASSADRLKSYIEQLINPEPNASERKLRATALAVGSFGVPAVLPLLSVIESGNDTTIPPAMVGLEQAGRVAPDRTCDTLVSVIEQSETFQWKTRKRAAQIAGRLGCGAALEPLKSLRAGSHDIDPVLLQDFKEALDQSIKQIEAAQRARSR